jgi:hypothetical protein
MCMKTNKSMTKCPDKIGHLRLRFGHFRLTDTNFAEIRGEFTVKRRQYSVCGRRSRLGRSERENPARNVESPGRGRIFDPFRVGTRFSGFHSRRFHLRLMTFVPFGEAQTLLLRARLVQFRGSEKANMHSRDLQHPLTDGLPASEPHPEISHLTVEAEIPRRGVGILPAPSRERDAPAPEGVK